jgi:mannonate dehydratase
MDHIGQITDEKLRFLQQMGVRGIMANLEPGPENKGYYSYARLLHLKTHVEAYGMELAALGGNTPWVWRYKWMLGLPGRDEQIENVQRTIQNMGAAGIPIFTYNIHALRFYRTSTHTPVRGGAFGTGFEARLAANAPLYASTGANTDLIPPEHRRRIGDEEMWDNLRYFMDAVLPVAEEAGVQMAMHPDDPPIPEIGGVARIMRSPEAFRRLIEMYPSESNKLLFCVGCFTEMGADVPAEIRYFGERDKLAWVHFRNTTGPVSRFVETFPDEGDTDLFAAMQAFDAVGYKSYLCPDHRLRIVGDSDWGHRYWAYALGYTKALLMAAKSQRGQS